MIGTALDLALYAFVTLIALVNPISAAAVFVTVTEGRSPADQAQIARRATIIAGITLIAFAFAGEALLNALGVEIGAFKIAGGLLLLRVAFNMVFANAPDRDKARENAQTAPDPSVFPLAIPMISGPGALTASVTLINPAPGHQVLNEVVFVVVALIVMGITYVFMRGAEKLTKWIGEAGVDAISRIVGIIVAAIAVQLVVNGVSGLTSLKL
ncbi:MAG TPA: MarC family protein [Candidatus Cybelea sp.]|nr:MarC family protein [Candidatus Cybelea sp.]